MSLPPPPIETPLQAALRGPGGAALVAVHQARLARLESSLARGLAAGLPPADFAFARRLLTMLQAGQQVLAALPAPGPALSTPASGPAWRAPSLPIPSQGELPWPPPAPSRPPPG